MPHIPGHQSDRQKQTAFQGAALTEEKQQAVTAGVQSSTPPIQSAGVIDSTVLEDTQDIQFTQPQNTTPTVSALLLSSRLSIPELISKSMFSIMASFSALTAPNFFCTASSIKRWAVTSFP